MYNNSSLIRTKYSFLIRLVVFFIHFFWFSFIQFLHYSYFYPTESTRKQIFMEIRMYNLKCKQHFCNIFCSVKLQSIFNFNVYWSRKWQIKWLENVVTIIFYFIALLYILQNINNTISEDVLRILLSGTAKVYLFSSHRYHQPTFVSVRSHQIVLIVEPHLNATAET